MITSRVQWSALDTPGKFYRLAKLFMAVPVVGVFFYFPDRLVALGSLTLPMLFMWAAGFLVWALPKTIELFLSRWGKLAFVLVQALVVPCCVGLARHIVANALGLPPQFLDLTVTLVSVLLVPLAWILLLALVAVCGAGAAMFLDTLTSFMKTTARVQHLKERTAPSKSVINEGDVRRVNAHCIGLFIVATAMLWLSVSYEEVMHRPDWVRKAAYMLDFTTANNYPGVPPGQSFRLLDDGKIAYAYLIDDNVIIEVVSRKP